MSAKLCVDSVKEENAKTLTDLSHASVRKDLNTTARHKHASVRFNGSILIQLIFFQ